MTKGRSNLLPNQVGPHIPFWQNAKDFFQYPGWENHVNHVYEEFDIVSDQTSVTRGTKQTFQIDRRGDRLTSIDLIFQRTGASGTGGAFEDWEPYAAIDNVEIYYNNKLIWRKRMEKRVLDIMEKCTPEERAALARLGNGDLSYNERVVTYAADFSSPKTMTVSLGVPWEKLQKSICMLGLPNKIRVEVNWKTFAQCTVNPSASSLTDATTRTAYLKCGFWHLPEDLRQHHFAQVQSPTGLRYKILTEEFQIGESFSCGASVTSGTFNAVVRLTNIRNSVVAFKSILRHKPNVSTDTTRDSFHMLGHDVYLRDNGSQVTDTALYQFAESELPITSGTRAYHKWRIGNQINPHHPTAHGAKTTRVLFCPPKVYPMSEDHCFGSRNISGYNNPEYYLSISVGADTDYHGVRTLKKIYLADGSIPSSSDTSSDYEIDIYGEIHNILIQKQGDLRPLFAY